MTIAFNSVAVVAILLIAAAYIGRRLGRHKYRSPGKYPPSQAHESHLVRSIYLSCYGGALLYYGYLMWDISPGWNWSTHCFWLGSSFILLSLSAWLSHRLRAPKEAVTTAHKVFLPSLRAWVSEKIGVWKIPRRAGDKYRN